jgi:hypothetical protein
MVLLASFETKQRDDASRRFMVIERQAASDRRGRRTEPHNDANCRFMIVERRTASDRRAAAHRAAHEVAHGGTGLPRLIGGTSLRG